jgi:hypothetical protein
MLLCLRLLECRCRKVRYQTLQKPQMVSASLIRYTISPAETGDRSPLYAGSVQKVCPGSDDLWVFQEKPPVYLYIRRSLVALRGYHKKRIPYRGFDHACKLPTLHCLSPLILTICDELFHFRRARVFLLQWLIELAASSRGQAFS